MKNSLVSAYEQSDVVMDDVIAERLIIFYLSHDPIHMQEHLDSFVNDFFDYAQLGIDDDPISCLEHALNTVVDTCYVNKDAQFTQKSAVLMTALEGKFNTVLSNHYDDLQILHYYIMMNEEPDRPFPREPSLDM